MAPMAPMAPAGAIGGQAPVVAPPPASAIVPRIIYDESDEDEVTTVAVSDEVPGAPVLGDTTVIDPGALHEAAPGMHDRIALSATYVTDKGLRRKRNEDRAIVFEEPGVFAVADGMGGLRGGEIASTVAVDALREAFEKRAFEPIDSDLPMPAKELAAALSAANSAVFRRAQAQRELRGMGTTMTAARFSRSTQRVYVAHVGDSRLYRLRRGEMKRLTKDHTMVELGVTGEEAGNLSRALGIWPRVPVDVILDVPEPGDVYVLCSDGLTKMVEEPDIARVVAAGGPLDEVAGTLVRMANENGGKDNVTVVLVRIEAPKAVSKGM